LKLTPSDSLIYRQFSGCSVEWRASGSTRLQFDVSHRIDAADSFLQVPEVVGKLLR